MSAPAPGGWDDPGTALSEAFDLVEALHQLSRAPEVFSLAEVTALDARVEEMRRRVEHITGERA